MGHLFDMACIVMCVDDIQPIVVVVVFSCVVWRPSTNTFHPQTTRVSDCHDHDHDHDYEHEHDRSNTGITDIDIDIDISSDDIIK